MPNPDALVTPIEESDRVCKQHFDQGCYWCLTHWNKARVKLQSNDDSLPLAQQRPSCLHHWLPACYRDFIPEPPRPLPPSMEAWKNPGEVEPSDLFHPLDASPPSCPAPDVPSLPSCPKIKTQLNSFGLFWLYNEDSLPIYDPDTKDLSGEALSSLHEGNSIKFNKGITGASNPFYLYPNETSLLLGDWYWNQGHQQSQASFKKLLNIIGHSEYYPEDVQNMNWVEINRKLGNSGVQDDLTEGDCEWFDDDSGWKKMAIRICTPFHRHTQHPGSRDYIVEDFHYHSLVDIIRENVSNPTHHWLFHYEPYELHWQPPHKANDVRVYGKLYTSESFLTAHRQLQDSLPEFGCTLPWCIIRLMLWLDATHLTAFGTAKLWPLYVYMGNELKYMHFQPSSNLSSHMAYFHMVSLPNSILVLYNYVLKWNK